MADTMASIGSKRQVAAGPQTPEQLNDRAAEVWEPLLVLADLAGGDWETANERQ